MRVAHIIMVHKSPEQLLRLVKKLDHAQFDFYIHVDKKVDILAFEHILTLPNLKFIKNRVNCNWGGNSLLTGIVSALTEVLSFEVRYDFINLLSAQDYPLYPAESIYTYLEANKGTNFISFDASRQTDWWKAAVSRYEKYHFTDLNIKSKYFFQKVVNTVMPKRKFPIYAELYGGSKSTWWTITYDCAKLISDQLSNNRKLIKFIRYSWGTDEFIVATIIMNSKFRDSTVNNNLRYIDWSEGNPNPKLLGMEDLEKITASKMLFARKFDISYDKEVLTSIDNRPDSINQV
ncbi:hypothetical protein ABIE26_001031 [Pedobacter africanus]|nr:beta-1,6-N-acetylglucosaminyltransferase [Pedobacter africanus]